MLPGKILAEVMDLDAQADGLRAHDPGPADLLLVQLDRRCREHGPELAMRAMGCGLVLVIFLGFVAGCVDSCRKRDLEAPRSPPRR